MQVANRRRACSVTSIAFTINMRKIAETSSDMSYRFLLCGHMRNLAIIAFIFLGGCGLSQSHRVESNKKVSSLSLCQSLQNKDNYMKYLPKQYKTDLESEVASRGVNCELIIGAENGRLASERVLDRERDRNTLRNIDNAIDKAIDVLAAMGASQAQQQSQKNVSTPRSGVGIMCQKKYEWTSGINKNCSYDCGGSEAVQTVDRTDMCPISITR